MRDHVKRKAVAKCEACGGYIKPDIVFFGEGVRWLPNSTLLFYHPKAYSFSSLRVSRVPSQTSSMPIYSL